MKIIPASDSSLLVVFGNVISPDLHELVISLFEALRAEHDNRIRNLHPGYASLLVDFDPLRLRHQDLASRIRQLATPDQSKDKRPANLVTIPVCYGFEFGPDLAEVASQAKMPVEEVIRTHTSVTYIVYFLGFSPGFAYLGGLPAALHTPRLTTPRKYVAAGTVGVAGSQTGVYPIDSPGGWRLIGRTPLRMFDPNALPPTRLQPGDKVKFCAIDRQAFEELGDRAIG